MTFPLIRVGELFSSHVRPEDWRRLHKMWTEDPTLTLGLHELGMFIETGGAPDDEDLADINEFVRLTYEDYGFSSAFMTIVRVAQDQGLAFVHLHPDADPDPDLHTFDQ